MNGNIENTIDKLLEINKEQIKIVDQLMEVIKELVGGDF